MCEKAAGTSEGQGTEGALKALQKSRSEMHAEYRSDERRSKGAQSAMYGKAADTPEGKGTEGALKALQKSRSKFIRVTIRRKTKRRRDGQLPFAPPSHPRSCVCRSQIQAAPPRGLSRTSWPPA